MLKARSMNESRTNDRVEWHLLDASTMPLGRLATEAATLLMGKHRADFARHQVAPVRVVVINSDTLKVTGNKMEAKFYRHYSGYPGGLKERTLKDQIQRDSRVVIEEAVSGMLPKNNLRKQMMVHLKVYKGAEHPHAAQIESAN